MPNAPYILTPKTLLFTLLCMWYTWHAHAAHIIGGDVTYQHVSYNSDSTIATFAVEFIIYRDTAANNPYFDLMGSFGVFRSMDGVSWESYDVVNNIPVEDITLIDALEDPCKDLQLSNISIESGTYRFSVDLLVGDYQYMVAYQRCCRNYTINNIERPGETGAVYDVILSPQSLKEINNSPVFKEYPPTYVCMGQDIDFDHGAIDTEADSLVYSFCTPFSSGVNVPNPPPICCDCVQPNPRVCIPEFDHVVYTSIYNETNPIGGDPQIQINSRTGMINGVPNLLGSYVVGVCVTEYREGIYMGSYRRDFEFNVAVCDPRVYADLKSDEQIDDPERAGGQIHMFRRCEPEILIENRSFEIDNIRTYEWMIYDESNQLVATNFDRNAMLQLPDYGVYSGHMVINDLEKCVDTAHLHIEILPLIEPSFDVDFDICELGDLYISNTSIFEQQDVQSWHWEVNGQTYPYSEQLPIRNPVQGNNTVRLTIEDHMGCTRYTEQDVFYQLQIEQLIEDNQQVIICPGDSVLFEGMIVKDVGTYDTLYTAASTGCDSLYRSLRVEHFPGPRLQLTDTIICNGETLNFRGVGYDSTGTYTHMYKYADGGCDSLIHTLELEVSRFPIFITQDTMICPGDSVRFEQEWVFDPGTYKATYKSTRTQCDSFVYTLEVRLFPDLEFAFKDTTVCYGDSVRFEREWYYDTEVVERTYYNQNGCDSLLFEYDITIEEPLTIISVCADSIKPYVDYTIDVETNRSVTAIWEPAIGLSCTDCLRPKINLDMDQSYTLTVVDDLGCTITKTFEFFVDPIIDFYMPNIISNDPLVHPNNRYAFLQCDPEYTFHYNMYIFDRWGNVVCERLNIETNDPQQGWDPGDYLAGVYAYFIEIIEEVTPGELNGDLTMVR